MRKNPTKFRLIAVACAALLVSTAPALAARWVPAHYGPNGYWHPGHWIGGYGVWIAGHYGPDGFWHRGHWAGGYGPPPGPYESAPTGVPVYGQHWVPGFYGPQGRWHRGYWAPN